MENEKMIAFDGADSKLCRELIQTYGDSDTMFMGNNSEGEMITISIDRESGIIVTTYQRNGWVRKNYYDTDGLPNGETFEGRWK